MKALALLAVAAACALAGCGKQQEPTTERTTVTPARSDSAGPGGSTGPVGVPPSSTSPAQGGVTGSGSAPGYEDRGATSPGVGSTGGLQSTTPAASAAAAPP